MQIELTNFQLVELAYKLEILAGDDDMLDNYNIDENRALALHDYVRRLPVPLHFNDVDREIFIGEFENLHEIAKANASHSSDPEERKAARAFRDAIKRLESAK